MNQQRQPWIYSGIADSAFVLAPPFVVLLLIVLFPSVFHDGAVVSPLAWIVLVLCIDVSHVYSTLYRTYFDKESFARNKTLYTLIPLFVFIISVMLYSYDALLFWRIAAYLAVFHFIRQQYGFLRIYSRRGQQSRFAFQLDRIMIYTATLYPVLWWHLNGPREFSWFVDGDFIFIHAPWLLLPLKNLYFLILATWVIHEGIISFQKRSFNVPRFFLVLGTVLSWYIGIVQYNGDLVFTALNVISHGIPYMALIWMHGNKRTGTTSSFLSRIFRPRMIFAFIGILVVAAYLEEGLWDSLVWQDHPGIFRLFHSLPQLSGSVLSIVVPLLAVPQLTHYVLDGFIWRIRKDNFDWKKVTLGE